MINGGEIWTAGRCWPQIDALPLIEILATQLACLELLSCIKRYSVPWNCFSMKKADTGPRFVCTTHRPIFDHKHIFVAPLLEIPPYTCPWLHASQQASVVTLSVFWLSSSWRISCTELSSVQMTFSNASLLPRHNLANSHLLAFLSSEIIGLNLVCTTTHFRCIRMYLCTVSALMLTEKLLNNNLCTSAEDISLLPCSFASTKVAIPVVVFNFRPERCWSLKPWFVLQRNTHHRIVARKVLHPFDSTVVKISSTVFPSSNKTTVVDSCCVDNEATESCTQFREHLNSFPKHYTRQL